MIWKKFLKNINTNIRTAQDELGLDEHGKIVSIGDNDKLYALHDDGYVDNVSQNTGINDGEWDDIIQISPVLDGKTSVALNSKGKMCYGNVEWADNMAKWDNIVAFKTYNNVQQGGAMVIGLSNNGNLYGAIDDAMQNYIKGEYDSILAQFKNVLRFDFSVDISLDSTFAEALNIVAITKDNTIVSYVIEIAVNSAKVIIVVGSSEENFEKLIDTYQKFWDNKNVIPVYSQMDAYNLPSEIANLQAVNYDTIGSIAGIINNVSKKLGKTQNIDVLTDADKKKMKRKRTVGYSFGFLGIAIISFCIYIVFGTHYVLDSKKYQYAQNLEANGSYIEALEIYSDISDYKDVSNRKNAIYDKYNG